MQEQEELTREYLSAWQHFQQFKAEANMQLHLSKRLTKLLDYYFPEVDRINAQSLNTLTEESFETLRQMIQTAESDAMTSPHGVLTDFIKKETTHSDLFHDLLYKRKYLNGLISDALYGLTNYKDRYDSIVTGPLKDAQVRLRQAKQKYDEWNYRPGNPGYFEALNEWNQSSII